MPTILVDGNNVGMANFFVNPELTDPIGRPSGAIYGFIKQLRPILARVQQEHGRSDVKVIVAWDGGNIWRKDILPSYKASRGDKSRQGDVDIQAYFDQVPRLKDMLRIMGVHQFIASRYEADDIAGLIANRINMSNDQLTLVTNDKDWLQLVGQNVHMWRPLADSYATPANFEELTECTSAEEFVKVKAIMGDKGDDVPGVAGVGIKTALKYLRGELTKGKKFEDITKWMDDPDGYERSLKLVDLRDMQIPHEFWQLTNGQYDQGALLENMVQLAFDSILSNFSNWIAPFKLSNGVHA